MNIEELRNRMAELSDECNAITSGCDADQRDPTQEEKEKLLQLTVDFEDAEQQIELLQKVDKQNKKLEEGVGRLTDPELPESTVTFDDDEPRKLRSKEPARPIANQNKWGWRNLGEFAVGVKQAARNGANPDPRLVSNLAATTYGSEGVGADGGFAVPPDFRNTIAQMVAGESSLISMTDQLVSSSNTISIPTDETTPWQTSGGILANWEGEAGTLTQTKPSIGQTTVRLNKLSALVPVTEELLEDAPALSSYLTRKAPEKMNFKISLAIVQGSGSGQPLGIINSPALVSVAKEGSQSADTIVFQNIIKMWARLYGPSRANAVWLINQDIEPQLMSMAFTGTESPFPMYMPPGGLSASPYGTLMGRPVIPTQACETLGDKGDIILCDLKQYLTAQKVGGIRSETSIHLWFDQDITAFRFIMRVAGQPWWGSTISVRDGSNTLSSFVTLDERA